MVSPSQHLLEGRVLLHSGVAHVEHRRTDPVGRAHHRGQPLSRTGTQTIEGGTLLELRLITGSSYFLFLGLPT